MPNKAERSPSHRRMPVIFAAHGAPVLLDDELWMGELAGWARALPRPTAVLMVSAHWERRPTTLGATRTVPLVYDFHGFPERYYATRYPAPGAPELAQRVPTFGFTLRGVGNGELARRLGERGIFVWAGHHYALTLMERLGLGAAGVVRVGAVHYNTAAEVGRLLGALDELAR